MMHQFLAKKNPRNCVLSPIVNYMPPRMWHCKITHTLRDSFIYWRLNGETEFSHGSSARVWSSHLKSLFVKTSDRIYIWSKSWGRGIMAKLLNTTLWGWASREAILKMFLKIYCILIVCASLDILHGFSNNLGYTFLFIVIRLCARSAAYQW